MTFDDYIASAPEDRRVALSTLVQSVRSSIDPKFSEVFAYGMIGWAISKDIYPAGYHVDPSMPVSFLGLANQKHYIALYHMGIYADSALLKWFTDEYAKTGEKLDMGKSCIRFKKMDKIPYKLIAELAGKMSLYDYLALYTAGIRR